MKNVLKFLFMASQHAPIIPPWGTSPERHVAQKLGCVVVHCCDCWWCGVHNQGSETVYILLEHTYIHLNVRMYRSIMYLYVCMSTVQYNTVHYRTVQYRCTTAVRRIKSGVESMCRS